MTVRRDATGQVLAFDTATATAAVALGGPDGALTASRTWETKHRPGHRLLDAVAEVLAESRVTVRDLSAVAVGVGPGSFTGLRVALATAKTLAYALEVPLVAVSTPLALATACCGGTDAASLGDASAGGADGVPSGQVREYAVGLPAGATDRYLVRVRCAAGATPELAAPAELVARDVDLERAAEPACLIAVDIVEPGISADAQERGRRAILRLPAGLLAIAAVELAGGRTADAAELVPAYVAPPRGVTAAAGAMVWSPDLR